MFSHSPSKDAWWRRSAFPQYEKGVDLTFLIAIMEFLVENIPPDPGIVLCSCFTVIFCSRAWDGKASIKLRCIYMGEQNIWNLCRLKNVDVW